MLDGFDIFNAFHDCNVACAYSCGNTVCLYLAYKISSVFFGIYWVVIQCTGGPSDEFGLLVGHLPLL